MKRIITILLLLPLFLGAQNESNEPAFPYEIEIVKALFKPGLDTIRGWEVEFNKEASVAGITSFRVKLTCLNKTNTSLPFYYYRLTIASNPFFITIDMPKEEMERRQIEINKN